MFNTARTSAKTLLVAASTAGFVALGAGIAGADALGGATDGLALNDLGSQVPAPLTEGLSTPLGELVKVEPGQISAQPDVRRQSAPEQPLGPVAGNAVSTDTPIRAGEENATNVGPLDLNTVSETLPLSGAESPLSGDPLSGLLGGSSGLGGLLGGAGGGTLPLSHASTESLASGPVSGDPLSGLLGGSSGLGGSNILGGLLGGATGGAGGGTLPLSHASTESLASGPVSGDPLSGLLGGSSGLGGLLGGVGGGTLPLSHPESSLSLQDTRETVGTGINQLGSSVERGTHEVGSDLNGLDATLPASGDTLPLAAADTPTGPINGQNTDLTGGTADLVSDLVLSDDVTLPMSASTSSLPETVTDASADLLPLPEGTLPMAAAPEVSDVTDLAVDAVRTTQLDPSGDFVGNDLVGVDGMPDLGQPGLDTSQLNLLPDSIA
ncbi:hypothetical protein [Nocardiopsis alborubida]|uniref:Uncharacterized protein n=1 Tax=Nocardiopsis alborubida TaxID=146802 RepID=A0A7X6MC74_9ACTN|nr:hypothetical protein [Nocardiopsis alborubida]NKY97273.1 hypothetical protein [Nocardiopsis alborubida]